MSVLPSACLSVCLTLCLGEWLNGFAQLFLELIEEKLRGGGGGGVQTKFMGKFCLEIVVYQKAPPIG